MHNLAVTFFSFNQVFATLALIPHPQRGLFGYSSFLTIDSIFVTPK